MKNRSIFNNNLILAILSVFGGALTTLIIDWFKTKNPEVPLLWIIVAVLILFLFVLYQIDFRNELKKINNDVSYIKEKVDLLINMNKKGQYEKLRLFLIIFIVSLLIFYVLYETFIK